VVVVVVVVYVLVVVVLVVAVDVLVVVVVVAVVIAVVVVVIFLISTLFLASHMSSIFCNRLRRRYCFGMLPRIQVTNRFCFLCTHSVLFSFLWHSCFCTNIFHYFFSNEACLFCLKLRFVAQMLFVTLRCHVAVT
jgi:hypothetical protein